MGNTERGFVILSLVFLAIIALRPSIRGNDGVGHYVFLASMLRAGDLNFRDDYRAFDDIKQYPYQFSKLPICAETGFPSNRYGIGASLLWSPFVAATHLGLKYWAHELADGISRPYEWAVGVATVFWGSLGLAILYHRLRENGSPLAASGALLALIFASPLGFYLYAHGSMAHGVEFFSATLVFLTFERSWKNLQPLWVAACGASLALLVMIRVQNVTWPLVLGAALCYRIFSESNNSQRFGKKARDILVGMVPFVSAAAVVFLPQFIVWQTIYGHWYSGPTPYLDGSAGRFIVWPKYLFHALFSERGGALAWHPAIAVGLVSLLLSAFQGKGRRTMAVVGLAGFAAQAWIVGCWSSWWGGASFGNRFFISSLPWIGLGLTQWLTVSRPGAGYRRLLLLSLLMLWNFGLLVQYATELVPREDPVPWSRVIRQNLVDVPRMVRHHLMKTLD